MNNIWTKLILILLLCGCGYLVIANFPKSTVESSDASEFIMNCPFKNIQKGLKQGKFEQETLRINGATIVEKKWIDKQFHMERILRKDRYWEFRGQLHAKVQVDNPRAGKLTVDLIEDIEFAIDHINITTTLLKPLEIGVTDMKQTISIVPVGDNQTKVRLTSYLKLHRVVPKNWKQYAQEQMDGAARDSIQKMTAAIKSLDTPGRSN